jgi:quercetin dioxygenase-like cupin family protein
MQTLPLPVLRTWRAGEGEVVNPLDLSFTWKAKGPDTGFAFGTYEMTIQPGQAIPIHLHPYPEFFYVLDGRIDFQGLDPDGALTHHPVSAGGCANAPANAPHGTANRSGAPARFLSVSNYEH